MANRQAACPACGRKLVVPVGCANCVVRCSICHHQFRLPRRIRVSDDVVADWLAVTHDEDDSALIAATPDGQTVEEAQGEHSAPVATPQGEADQRPLREPLPQGELPERIQKGQEVPGGEIEIIALDDRGVVFQFHTQRLMNTSFRMALPRECIRCRAKAHLRPYPVVYVPNMDLSGEWSISGEYRAGEHFFSETELRSLGNEEILQRLGQVPNVPFPANLPMPYWLCDMCSSRGMVSGKIEAEASGEGFCRLFIQNLCVAEAFLVAAGGRGTPAQKRLLEQIVQVKEDPWQCMPNAVQNRIQKWFRPDEGEAFIAYVPDRKHTRIEDGVAGLLVSNRRLIFHTAMTHKEVPANEKLDLELVMDGEKGDLRVRAERYDLTLMTVDREGIARLRRALWKARYQAHWH